MITSLLYAVYALAASAALVQGTRMATAAGTAVAAYLLLRLAGSLGRLRHPSPVAVPSDRIAPVPLSAREAGRP